MKKILLVLPVTIILAGFYNGRLIDDRVKSLLQTLKLSENDAKETIFSDISYPSFYFPGIKELKSIALNNRASQVEVIGKYVKGFTKSDDFKKRYNQYRELKKPKPPEKPKTMKQQKNEDRENLKKNLEEMKQAQASASADQKEYFNESIKYLEEQLKTIDDPNNTIYSPEMDTYIQQGYQQLLDQYNKEVADWEAKYPVNNPNGMIKNWLKEFIDKTKDVDFSAETAIDQYGRTVFVKQSYEGKDHLWKLCYRAGKGTTDAARRFAQNWLSELK
jgi:hypothetical protein